MPKEYLPRASRTAAVLAALEDRVQRSA